MDFHRYRGVKPGFDKVVRKTCQLFVSLTTLSMLEVLIPSLCQLLEHLSAVLPQVLSGPVLRPSALGPILLAANLLIIDCLRVWSLSVKCPSARIVICHNCFSGIPVIQLERKSADDVSCH